MSKQETWPRKADSSSYLEHHKLIPLLQNVTAHILYDQPENPRDYMIEYLKKLQEAKRTKRNYPSLFDESHLRSVFLLLDPAETGRINLEQYKQAMKTLGIDEFNANPKGWENNAILWDTFLMEARTGLQKASITHAPTP